MKIEHVALYVKDLEKAKDFFVTYLNGKANNGYHNQNTDFRSYFITFEAFVSGFQNCLFCTQTQEKQGEHFRKFCFCAQTPMSGGRHHHK